MRTAARLLELHKQGIYTKRELIPGMVMVTPLEQLGIIYELLPDDLRQHFVDWVHDYPLEGGVLIHCDAALPDEKMIWLKENTPKPQ